MSETELQDEEREALLSIYDGDDNFKQLTSTTFQYKYGENNDSKSFLLELHWVEKYPFEKPIINMDTFYNKHLSDKLKEKIVKLLSDCAEQYMGMSMTYSLFEYVKEKFDDIINDQLLEVENDLVNVNTEIDKLIINEAQDEEKQLCTDSTQKPVKKEHLTKAQKRRRWDKMDGSSGERARGWNWVDIVKHLSQTGTNKVEVTSTT